MPKLASKRRQELVDHLVGNCNCDTEALFDENDVETLNKFEIDQLEELAGNLEEDENESLEEVENASKEEETVENSKLDTEEKDSNMFDEKNLPPEILEDLKFARNMKRQQQDQLIAQITTNEDGLFSKKELQAKSVDELQKIASYVKNSVEEKKESPAPKGRRLGGHLPIRNESATEAPLDDILEAPVIDWNQH